MVQRVYGAKDIFLLAVLLRADHQLVRLLVQRAAHPLERLIVSARACLLRRQRHITDALAYDRVAHQLRLARLLVEAYRYRLYQFAALVVLVVNLQVAVLRDGCLVVYLYALVRRILVAWVRASVDALAQILHQVIRVWLADRLWIHPAAAYLWTHCHCHLRY